MKMYYGGITPGGQSDNVRICGCRIAVCFPDGCDLLLRGGRALRLPAALCHRCDRYNYGQQCCENRKPSEFAACHSHV